MTDVVFPGDDSEDEAWQHVFSDSDVQQKIMRREMLLEPKILCEKLPFHDYPKRKETNMSVDSYGNPIQDDLQPRILEFKSEAQLASELKDRAEIIMNDMCLLMDECAKHGFRLVWTGIGVTAWGKNQVVDLHLEKRF